MTVFLTEPEAKVLGIETRRGVPLAKPKIKVKRKSVGEEMFMQQCKLSGITEPEREYRFHPTRRWRFDFAWPEVKLALEVDGSVYSNGRHNRGKGYENDCEKMAEAINLGWRVFRFSTGQVKKGIAIKYLESALG